MQRRTLFKWLVVSASAVLGAIVAVPAVISALAPAARPREKRWHSLGALRQFPPGQVVQAVVRLPREDHPVDSMPGQAVYVWRPSESQFIVFSRTCTDLGCAVKYDAGSTFYYCPCHGGIFNSSGEPVAGPPKKPLYRYVTRVRDNALEIDLSSVPAVA